MGRLRLGAVLEQTISAVAGAVLIGIGLILVIVQFFRSLKDEQPFRYSRSAGINRYGFSVRTNYIGLVLILVGALLEIIVMLIPG